MHTDSCTWSEITSATAAILHVNKRRCYAVTCWYMRRNASNAQSATILPDAEKIFANTSLVCIAGSLEENAMRKRLRQY